MTRGGVLRGGACDKQRISFLGVCLSALSDFSLAFSVIVVGVLRGVFCAVCELLHTDLVVERRPGNAAFPREPAGCRWCAAPAVIVHKRSLSSTGGPNGAPITAHHRSSPLVRTPPLHRDQHTCDEAATPAMRVPTMRPW